MAKIQTLEETVKKIRKNDRVCYNCASMIWAVGLGLGFKCRDKRNNHGDGRPKSVHPAEIACEYFKFKKTEKKKTNRKRK